MTVIAAGFDGGAPAYRPAETPQAPVAVLQLGRRAAGGAAPAPPVQPPRRVLFDDVDVPDFLKNGS